MLIEISCDKFRVTPLPFKSGLNVVLGDDNGSNSIGKTSLLLVIDFVFGGDSLISKEDIVKELGHHDYCFKFKFDDEVFDFRRGTLSPDTVYFGCEGEEHEQAKKVEDYRAFLSNHYVIGSENNSFRQVVSLYSRIWGKGNLNVRKPLHVVPEISAKKCVLDLIKLFDRYSSIERLQRELDEAKEVKKAFKDAYNNQIIKKISASTYKENKQLIERISGEISEIEENLAKYLVNFSEILNREMLGLRGEKDSLLESQMQIKSKLNRTKANLAGNKFVKSKNFEALLKFFPSIEADRLAGVEEFHSHIVRLLRSELKATEKNLSNQLEQVDSEIRLIDSALSEALSTTNAPSAVVDRVVDLAKGRKSSIDENRYYESAKDIASEAKDKAESLSDGKGKVVKEIEALINKNIKAMTADVFGAGSKTAVITLEVNNYEYVVPEDTGTGTAYNALLFFDLAILWLTCLPMLIHDSPLFKNIENDSLGRIFGIYSDSDKQTFIAIDEKEKYGNVAAEILSANSIIRLDRNHLLYTADWRSKQT